MIGVDFKGKQRKTRNCIFFHAKMNSLANILTIGKALVQNIFGHKIFICQPFVKIFVAFFRTFGIKNKVICKKKKVSLV